MRSVFYPLPASQVWVLIAFVAGAGSAFLPGVGAVELLGVSLTAWLLLLLMVLVPIVTIVVTSTETD
ncbi:MULTISPECIES: hypothetical protein [Pseudonocardia]|uniref:Uncharacterized protein n=2 Tax=Pseudonocardia TaxID=1847 RepID=A0A1Y2NBF9_PSEAH|nr:MULTISPECIES: hypothetical protein [Pseudonocardia]OSY44228.1 hypothetical protein BG845_00349 [Pseudonocardia autotrophica]TDN74042.1 hypothetical protein C8E95_3157 [Pseudonocardia autotrophica]BBG04799.1 hypothetical protein Pdca_60080 [Pseudonocardia autotrophica]GEC23455.1 hypothetical protein PSA01_04840 [Pseudonocardia saturnea]